jgi:lipopolysaccharide transport system ATP-binding protein
MIGIISVNQLGKAYKQYSTRWGRLAEWLSPKGNKHSTSKWILRNVTFSVGAGETVGIIGVNGAGKSTLLKMITGASQATEGSVKLTGKVAALLELGMGFHPEFTGRQNVLMAGQLLGLNQKLILSLMDDIEIFAEIGEYIDQPVRIYSSGMQVRLAFAVATAVRPDILIVDEALSVGDAHFQHKCFSRIRKFQTQGMTLLFVSHDLATVRALCEKAVWIDQGTVRQYGDTKKVLDEYSKAIYSQDQDIQSASDTPEFQEIQDESQIIPKRDFRLDFINNSNMRNDIELFEFKKSSDSWGDGKVKITKVYLTDINRSPLSWVIGGEEVVLTFEFRSFCNLHKVIVGFMVRDRLGQNLFGDNSYISTIDNPMQISEDGLYSAQFHFLMPIFPKGVYSVTVAVVNGTQQEHVVNEWVNDALFFESQNANSVNGLIGVPMHGMALEKIGVFKTQVES